MACLVYVTAQNSDRRSTESLSHGLAVEDRLSPALCIEASRRAGYLAEIIEIAPEDIDPKALPAILILDDEKAVVLIKTPENSKAEVYDPEADAVVTLSLPKLIGHYTGHAILLRKQEDVIEKDSTGHSHVEIDRRHWFWSVMRDNARSYGFALLAAVFTNIFALAGPLYIMNVYDRVLPSNAVETGWVLGLAVLVVYLFDLVVRTLRGYFIDIASRRADVILARKLMDQILDMKLMTRSGSINATANALREFDTLREFTTSATMVALVDLPFSLLFLAVVWLIGGPIALMVILVFAIVIAFSLLIQIPVKRLIFKAMKGNEIKHNLLLETLYNLETVKGVGGAGRLRKKYTDIVGQAALYNQRSRLWSNLAINFTAFAQQSTSVFIILIGMYLVADQALSVGGLIACVILSTRALAPIAQVAGLISKYFHAGMALRSLNKVMAIPKEREDGERFLSRPVLNGDFDLKNLGFAYPETGVPVVENISLKIKHGEKIGIIGKIGSGKSTLIKLMMHFYDPTTGLVLIDDTDIRQIDPADLRANIGYVSQDPGLFRGTVRENISLANPKATDGEILRASKLAGVHDFISANPAGYDAMIGDMGEGFSGGQKQAIAMARAFVTNPNILICDEPTNAMDSETEANLIRALKSQVTDKTFILVTHRMQMLDLVDRILVMQNGRLLIDGPRDKVLEALTKTAKPSPAAKEQNREQE